MPLLSIWDELWTWTTQQNLLLNTILNPLKFWTDCEIAVSLGPLSRKQGISMFDEVCEARYDKLRVRLSVRTVVSIISITQTRPITNASPVPPQLSLGRTNRIATYLLRGPCTGGLWLGNWEQMGISQIDFYKFSIVIVLFSIALPTNTIPAVPCAGCIFHRQRNTFANIFFSELKMFIF